MLIRQQRRLYRILSMFVFASLLIGLWGGKGATAAPPGGDFAGEIVTGETVTLAPAGRVSWEEMIAFDAAQPAIGRREILPWISAPAPQEAGLPFGGQSASGGDSSRPAVSDQIQSAGTLVDNFAALGDDNTYIPPDTMGAVGPDHLMTMLNTQVRIQNKNGGIISTVSLSAFWTSSTGLTGVPFDPHLVYDSLTGRWMATVDANAGAANSAVWFAVSNNSDPTGNWTFYGWDVDSTNTYWADYPGLGVNTDWVAITNNMYTVAGNSYGGPQMWVIDKSTLPPNGPLAMTAFARGFDNTGSGSGFTLKPALTFDAAETSLYIVDGNWSSGGTRAHRVSHVTNSSGTPVWANIGWYVVANNYDAAQINAAQLGTATRIETNDPRLLNAVVRNGHLWTTHSGGLPAGAVDRTAVFWYEVNPATPVIIQSGVIDGGADVHHYFPSIAVNRYDEVVIGFTRSDASRYAEAVFVSRQPTDSAGVVSPIQVIKAGEDSYVKDFGYGRVRWGDYSAAAVDPSDDQTLWTLQEYAVQDVGPNGNDDRWGTWWGKIQFEADLSITKTVTFNSPTNLTYAITVFNNGPADATGFLARDYLPPQVTYISNDCGATPPSGTTPLMWNGGNLSVGSSAVCNLTVTLNSGVTGWVANGADVTGEQADSNGTNNVATVAFSVPQAVDDNYTIPEDQSLNVLTPGVLGNDSDSDGDPLTAILATSVNHGTLTLQSDGSFLYVPDSDFNGVDTFMYRASDGSTLSPTATVTITVTAVNDLPIAVDDLYTTQKDETLSQPAPGVLGNDSDPDGDSLTANLQTPPAFGSLALQPDGAFDYDPALGFTGVVTFTYFADDGMGGQSPDATVTITVTENLPDVDAGSDQTTAEGTQISFTGTYTDPAPAPGDLVRWDFGDSTLVTGTLTPTHTYADNGIYTVTLTVTNTQNQVGYDTTLVTVINVAPVVVAGADQTISPGDMITLTASFSDPGTADTHTAQVDWGDGSPPQSVAPVSNQVTASHTYSTEGNYTVTVTVTDDDGGSGSDTLRVQVTTERRIYLPLVVR